MSEVKFRIAKPSDAGGIAAVHYAIRDSYPVGIFSRMGKPFLRAYYKTLLDDPYEIVVCAEEDGRIVGFKSATLNASHQMRSLRRHKFRLGIAALPSIVSHPSLLLSLLQRFRVTAEGAERSFVSTSGARGEFWGWSPDFKNPVASMELHELCHQIYRSLGVTELYGEVDVINKKVLKYHKLNGAEIIDRILLPDGRERVFIKYDLRHKPKFSDDILR